MEAPPKAPRIALCLAVLYVVWGSTYLAQRIALRSFPPLELAALRFLIAGPLLYGFLRLRGTPAPTRREWRAAAMAGTPLLVFGMGGVMFALQRVHSGLAALVFGSVPIWTSLFDRFWGGRLERHEIAGLALGFAGVLVVSLRGALAADPIGAAILVGAAACYSLGCVCTRRLPLARGPMATASEMCVAGVMLGIASVLHGDKLEAPSAPSLFALGYVVLFGSVLAYSAFGYLLQNARPALATSYAYVNPIVALWLGTLFAGEHNTTADFVGLGLVLAAVALSGLGLRKRGAAAGAIEPRGSRFA